MKFSTLKYYLYGCTIYPHTHLKLNKKNDIYVKSNLRELLLSVHNILSTNNIRYIISDGTLLGAYRDGNFIYGDDDIDLRIYKDDWDKTIRIINSQLHRNYNSNSNWIQIPKHDNNIFYIDFVKSDYTLKEPKWENVDYIFQQPTELIQINNIKVYGPSHSLIEKYLVSTFGNNWNTKICYIQNKKIYIYVTNVILFIILLLLIYFLYQKPYFIYITPILLIIILVIILSIVHISNKYVQTT